MYYYSEGLLDVMVLVDGVMVTTSKPKQVLFFFHKSFAGIPQNFYSAKLLQKNFVNLMGLPTFYLDS